MIITTAKGAKFDTELPAKSNIIKKLSPSGQGQVMQKLRITGNMTQETEFKKPVSMIEVEDEFGEVTEVNEDFLWQD